MSTNLAMLEKMGDLFETLLDINNGENNEFTLLKEYNYSNTNNEITLLNKKMSTLYKKIIIICHFNPDKNIVNSAPKLKKYVNLLGDSQCILYRHNNIVSKGNNNRNLISETQRKFVIVLPNLDNSNKNYDFTIAYNNGCHAICMKHQYVDNNLLGYNNNFKDEGNYSFIIKKDELINKSARDLGI